MKTKSVFVAMLIALSSAAFAMEIDKPGMTVVSVKGSEVFKVIYQGGNVGNVRLNIFDGQGKMIHSEAIRGLDGFIIPVNFKGLPSGAYTIEVVSAGANYREEINYRPFYESRNIHMSKVPGNESKFLLAIADAQNEPIRVTIYDSDERVLFDESSVIDGDLARVFKITQAQGRCRFEVSDAQGNKTHFNF